MVSGMALGNDGVAAAGTILAGGSTVAVLGSGINVLYPREHSKLFSEITNAFGGKLTSIVCGGAPINPKILKDLYLFGVTVFKLQFHPK